MPVILAIRRLRQGHQEFQASLNKTFSQRERGRRKRKKKKGRMMINPTLGINTLVLRHRQG